MPKRSDLLTGLTPQDFHPAAAPVNRLRQPTAGYKLAQLADGLSALNPSLLRFATVRDENEVREERLAGEKAARLWAEQGLTAKKAIEQGLMTPDQSEWFRFGAKEFMGRNSATRYRDFLRVKLAGSPVAESTELSEFDTFEREARAEFLKDMVGDGNRDEAFESGFGSVVDAVVSGERSSFSSQAGQRLVAKTGEEVHQRIMSVALDSSTGDISPEAAASVIKLDMERAIAMGMVDKGKVNRAAAQAIISAARQADDPDLLEILDSIEAGPGGLLGNLPDVAAAREEAFEQISSSNRVKERVAQERIQHEKQEKAEELGTSLIRDMVQASNPLAVKGFEQRVDEIAQYNSGYALSLYSARASILHGQNVEDPQATEELVLGVYTGKTTMHTALQAVAANEISLNGLGQVMNHLSQVQRSSGRGKGGINDPAFDADAYKHAERALLRQFGATDMIALSGEDEIAAQRAVGHLRKVWWDAYHNKGYGTVDWQKQDALLQPLVERTFDAYKGGPMGHTSAQAIPGGEGAPVWQQQRVIPDETLQALGGMLQRGNMTPEALQTLYSRYGVEPEQVATFYQQQRTFPFYDGTAAPLQLSSSGGGRGSQQRQDTSSSSPPQRQRSTVPGHARRTYAEFTEEVEEVRTELQKLAAEVLPEGASSGQASRRQRYNADRVEELTERLEWLRERMGIMEQDYPALR